MTNTNCPITQKILTELCDTELNRLLGNANYTQLQVDTWNTQIINNVLSILTPLAPEYKWILTSAIIEITPNTTQGMHAAQGAYWNCEKDGMLLHEWSNKQLRVILGLSWIHF
ncbi:hypothetical protein PCANB_000325 [Pneumocystis canis]|nr:hypothetical protein PCK1_000317 [Pneumocystis canis]KAG5437979.1 hypothetical protein PCANB_000325 [Pneumocystis canis]